MEKSFGFEPIEGVSDYHYVICSPYDADRMKEIIRGLKIYGLPIWYDKGMLADDQRKKNNQ